MVALTKNQAVEVRPVANGFVVMPALNIARDELVCDDDRLVFQTFAELAKWMGGHFTHRATTVVADADAA